MARRGRTNLGFSLTELLTALSVGAVLLALASPDFNSLIRSTRQSVALQKLGKTLAIARDRAVMVNTPVSVCASEDGQSCTDSAWQLGWIVFDDSINGTVVDPSESILLVSAALGGDIDIAADGHGAALTYMPDGTTLVPGSFRVCDAREPNTARSLCIERTGLVRNDEFGCDGEALTCP